MHGKLMEEILIPHDLLSIAGLELYPTEVVVNVASWEEPSKKGELRFLAAKLRSFDTTYSEEDLKDEPDCVDFPWDYFGFDSNSIDNARWRFTLNSHVLEIVFEAEWPVFTQQ